MTPRQTALFKYHMDTAKLLASKQEPVFWVLDLEDPIGFEMAVAIEARPTGSDPVRIGSTGNARLLDAKNSILSTDCIPASTAITTLDMANHVLNDGWKSGPLPVGVRFMALVSEGRIAVCQLPDTF